MRSPAPSPPQLAGATPVVAHNGEGHHEHSTRAGADPAKPEAKPGAKAEAKPEVDPAEVAVLGREHAEEHAATRAGAEDLGTYPQATRTARLKMLTDTQRQINGDYKASDFGAFKEYFDSPDFGVHIAQLPTGKVLLFSFERVETDPTKETAPTQIIGAANRGRAFLWDPAKGTGDAAFKKVTPPAVTMPDSTGISRPAPIFCAGHAFLPNGMLGVFGGNLGANGGSGAKLSFVFDPWSETWAMNEDMSVGRWYPSVVTGANGRMLIMSGQSELGWGTPTPIVERFPRCATRFRTARPTSPGSRASTASARTRRTSSTTRICSVCATGRSTDSAAATTSSGCSTRSRRPGAIWSSGPAP